MAAKSFKVPQPEFSDWVIRRRQKLNLSQAELREKVGTKISERTLKYLEGGKKDSFSDYTLNALAQGLNLSYHALMQEIERLQAGSREGGHASRKKPLWYFSFLFAILVIGLFFYAMVQSSMQNLWSKNNTQSEAKPSLQQVQDAFIHPDYPQVVVTHAADGKLLWQRNTKALLKKVAVFDLDKDGKKEIIAATTGDPTAYELYKPGRFFVWNEAGDLLTEFNTWKPSIYPAQEPCVVINDFQIVDLDKDGTVDIVAIIQGFQYYPSRLAVFHYQNKTLEEVKTYWNPGYLLGLYIEDVNGDGFPEIICRGVNNDLKRVPEFGTDENHYAFFMLDGRRIYGQAPPYLGKAEKGSQLWYYYITPDGRQEKTVVDKIMFMGEGEKEIYVKLRDTCFFYLNYAGEIIDKFPGDFCRWETALHLIPDHLDAPMLSEGSVLRTRKGTSH